MSADVDISDLADVSRLTTAMREHESRLAALGRERRAEIRRLRASGVTWRRIATAAGVTEQALYADVRKHPPTS